MSNALLSNAPTWAQTIRDLLERLTTLKRAEWNGPLFHLMPYCLHPMSDQHYRCIVNRRYKPIGYTGPSDFVSYEVFGPAHISVSDFERLRALGVVCGHGYLHTDGTTPRESKQLLTIYRGKLAAMIAPYVEPTAPPPPPQK